MKNNEFIRRCFVVNLFLIVNLGFKEVEFEYCIYGRFLVLGVMGGRCKNRVFFLDSYRGFSDNFF